MIAITYEQETIINFNAGEEMATVYTRDPAVMRKLDALVIEFPEVYRCIGATVLFGIYGTYYFSVIFTPKIRGHFLEKSKKCPLFLFISSNGQIFNEGSINNANYSDRCMR